MQIEIVNAVFHNGTHPYSFSKNGVNVRQGEWAIVETEKGKDLVKVESVEIKDFDENDLQTRPLKNVLRKADEKDLSISQANYKKVEQLLPEIKNIVREQGLEMKVISCDCAYNFSRLTINFTSDTRVDFRNLVKVLAEKYKARIELRQIGPREAARIIGGIGPCGKECCCKQGLKIDDHVTIKMAKTQGLSLNPNSVSGLCGKLLCCLAYENPYYQEMSLLMPKVNSLVSTPDGQGKVVYNDLLKKIVSVKFESENTSEIKEYDLDNVKFSK